MDTTSQEALWVLRAQCGDRAALELLLRRVEPSLRRYLSALVGPSDAEDVLQDVLIQVYRKLIWLRHPELLRPWAFRIANRAGIRHLEKRRQWSEQFDDRASVDDLSAATATVDERRLPDLLASCQISPACSAVLMLHFGEQMPLADVAAVLDIPLGTVKSRLAYGLAALRRQLGDRRG